LVYCFLNHLYIDDVRNCLENSETSAGTGTARGAGWLRWAQHCEELELVILPSARGAGWLRWAQAAGQIRFLCRFCGKISFRVYLFWILFYFVR
jgi:hypothetical protein